MEIQVAKSAGFCFGVARIVKGVLEAAKNGSVYTLGSIIHNKSIVRGLEEQGVCVVENVSELNGKPPGTVIIRAHGEPPEVYTALKASGFDYIDYTCPDVKKIQDMVAAASESGKKVIIIGDAGHPEIIGLKGHAGAGAVVLGGFEAVKGYVFEKDVRYFLVAQTTFNSLAFSEITRWLDAEQNRADIEVNCTICRATEERQREARKLSKNAGWMFVLGDKSSSNSLKLFEICRQNQINTFFIENMKEIEEKLLNISASFGMIIGVTAGASTPPAMIKEAVRLMSELSQNVNAGQDFANMIAGVNMVLRNGETVKGKVIKVANGEVFVDLGYKSDGIIQKGEYSDDHDADPSKELKPGDEIEVYVKRVNDGEGNVLLSKKHADGRKSMMDIEEAFKNNTPLKGKIIEIVKGGCIALVSGVRTFVPSSQVAPRFIADLNELKGKEFNFNILEFDKAKKRIVAGRKELAVKEQQDKKDKAFSTIQVGDRLKGTVSRIAQFGAFVDLGGVDGLIHISELSWGRIRRVTDILKEGDEVSVTVIDMDSGKGKISLTLKDVTSDPWYNIEEKYPIGTIVDGKVARIASFGAFVELEDGVDGLVHISQVASRHIEKVEEELKVGQIINVKVTAIDREQKRISLSKKVADNEISFEYLDDEYDDGAYEEYDEAYDENYDDESYEGGDTAPEAADAGK